MAYGELKVDSITFTDGGSDATVSVSGLVKNPTFSGNIVVNGNISGTIITGDSAGFGSVTGVTVTGTTANFVSGVFTTQVSGTAITGNTAGFTTVTGTIVTGTTANFVTVSGTTVTGDAAQFTSITGGTAGFTTVTGTTVTGTTANFVTVSGTAITGDTAGFTTVTGTTVTGTTANFVTVSGTTVTGDTGNFTSISATTTTITSGVFASGTEAEPSVSVGTTDNGLYSPGTDQVAISTNGTGRVIIGSSGEITIGKENVTNAVINAPESVFVNIDSNNDDTGEAFVVGNNRSSTTGGTELFRIQEDGKVGLGTSNPDQLFHVSSSSNTRAKIATTDTASFGQLYMSDEDKFLIGYGSTHPNFPDDLALRNNTGDIFFATGTSASAERARIDSSGKFIVKGVGTEAFSVDGGAPNDSLIIKSDGKVGLGTSSPTNILHVAGPDNAIVVVQTTTTTKNAGLQLRDSAGNLGTAFTYLSTSDDFRLNHAGSNVFNITSAGNVGIGTTSPQAALDVRSQIYVKGDNTGDGQTGIDIASGASAISTSTHRIRTGGGGGEDFILEAQTDDSEGSISLRANASSGRIVFTTNTSERARIDGSGTFRVKGAGTAGTDDAVQLNGSAPANSLLLDASGRVLVGTSSARTNFFSGADESHVQLEGTDFNTSNLSIVRNSVNSGSGALTLGKSRSATVNGNTVVVSGDNLGTIQFEGADGTNMVRGASIVAQVDGTPGADDMPGRLVFSTTADGASSPTEQMRISSDGIFYAGINVGSLNTTNFGTRIGALSNGTLAPGGFVSFKDDDGSGTVANIGGNAGQMRIYGDGDLENTNNSYTGISDIKLKENIVDANSQWDDLKAFQVRNYNFKPETGYNTHTQLGLIAQEVELVSPGLVGESIDEETGEPTKSVNYSVLYMKAVKALQEAMERIEVLEQRLADAGIA